MSQSLHVLGLAGSLRRGSYNRGLLAAAEELLPPGMTLEAFDLLPIPMYNADVEAVGVPEPVLRLRARLAAADGLLIATPEYLYSIPGVLKNALDWASRPPRGNPLYRKPVALMGAGGQMGTVRAQAHLRQMLLHNDVPVMGSPPVYIMRAREKFDEHGHLTDESSRQAVRGLLEAFAEWVPLFAMRVAP